MDNQIDEDLLPSYKYKRSCDFEKTSQIIGVMSFDNPQQQKYCKKVHIVYPILFSFIDSYLFH